MPKVDLEALRDIPDAKQRFVTARDVFAQARLDAANEVSATIKGFGRGSLQEAADIAGYDVGGLHRRLNKGGFVLPPKSLVRLAYNYLNESCNMLYFGTKGISVLPRHESVLLNILVQMDEQGKQEIFDVASEMLTRDTDAGTLAENLSDIEILRRRIVEIASDKFVRAPDVMGKDVAPNIKTTLRYLTSDIRVEVLTIKAIMYFALELRTSIDYFIATDYSQYTDVRFYNKTDDDIITDKKALRLFSLYLRVSDESKANLAALIYHYAMTHEITMELT